MSRLQQQGGKKADDLAACGLVENQIEVLVLELRVRIKQLRQPIGLQLPDQTTSGVRRFVHRLIWRLTAGVRRSLDQALSKAASDQADVLEEMLDVIVRFARTQRSSAGIGDVLSGAGSGEEP